jgi:predicted nucleic acid-binding protein
MPRYVVDASVAAKWYFDEEHSAPAARLLADDRFDLLAPDFVCIEVAAVAWKRVIRAEIEAEKAESVVRELLSVPLNLEPAVELVPAALGIALQTRRPVYDAIYLALAVQ